MAHKLMKISYYDSKSEVRLEAYADTVVLEKLENKTNQLTAIRFGGYPESVKAMSDAIYGGGSITIEMENGPRVAMSAVKQYRRELSHDGIYAEATLLLQDEEQKTENETDDNGKKFARNMPRKCYLFCEQGNSDRLFEELDKKICVPLIPEFKDYMLEELQNRNILKPLQIVSYKEKFDVWVLNLSENEKNIISAVEDGLQSGAIAMPGATGNDFPPVDSVTQYLNKFGVMIAERIKSQFKPLFDPALEALSPEILEVDANIQKNTGYSLFDAQLAVAEAHKRRLEQGKSKLCIAECGSGKTKIGITALHAYQQKKGKAKTFNIVLCPSHMTKKWVREIEESLSNTFAVVVGNITELNKVYQSYVQDYKTCYIIISKEKARDGYMKRPSPLYNRRKRGFVCPSCHETIMMDLINEGSKYKVKADQLFFKKENKDNHKCDNCGGMLWTVLVPNKQSGWIKVSDYGFIYRGKAHEHLDAVKKKPEIYDKIEAIKREEWVAKQVQCGIQVLISNPTLLETGLDLLDFTTLYYYNIGYNLFTLRQSSRRSWRINQTAPRIEVYFTYYEGTMQHRAMKLMASKLAVAGIIEGNFTDEGLAAMSDCQDMTTMLARELTMGIKNDVEDLSAVFKKMARLKPLNNVSNSVVEQKPVETIPIENDLHIPEQLLFMLTQNNRAPKVNGKPFDVWENQLSLFDYIYKKPA